MATQPPQNEPMRTAPLPTDGDTAATAVPTPPHPAGAAAAGTQVSPNLQQIVSRLQAQRPDYAFRSVPPTSASPSDALRTALHHAAFLLAPRSAKVVSALETAFYIAATYKCGNQPLEVENLRPAHTELELIVNGVARCRLLLRSAQAFAAEGLAVSADVLVVYHTSIPAGNPTAWSDDVCFFVAVRIDSLIKLECGGKEFALVNAVLNPLAAKAGVWDYALPTSAFASPDAQRMYAEKDNIQARITLWKAIVEKHGGDVNKIRRIVSLGCGPAPEVRGCFKACPNMLKTVTCVDLFDWQREMHKHMLNGDAEEVKFLQCDLRFVMDGVHPVLAADTRMLLDAVAEADVVLASFVLVEQLRGSSKKRSPHFDRVKQLLRCIVERGATLLIADANHGVNNGVSAALAEICGTTSQKPFKMICGPDGTTLLSEAHFKALDKKKRGSCTVVAVWKIKRDRT